MEVAKRYFKRHWNKHAAVELKHAISVFPANDSHRWGAMYELAMHGYRVLGLTEKLAFYSTKTYPNCDYIPGAIYDIVLRYRRNDLMRILYRGEGDGGLGEAYAGCVAGAFISAPRFTFRFIGFNEDRLKTLAGSIGLSYGVDSKEVAKACSILRKSGIPHVEIWLQDLRHLVRAWG